MGPIDVRPATPKDAVSIAEIHYKAIEKYHVFYAGFLCTHPRDIIPQSTESALQNHKNIFLVAVDTTTGQTMGFIRYQIVPEVAEAKQSPPEQPLAKLNQAHPSQSVVSLHAPKDHLKDLWKKFNEREDEMEACYQSAARGEEHFYVKHIMVDPVHQRKGIGAKLLSTVLERSDAEGRPTFLVASAEAHYLYSKLGFVDLGVFKIDNEAWSREVLNLERKLGIDVDQRFEEECKGLHEVESYMVRWANRAHGDQ